MPLLDEGAKLVSGDIHSVEVCVSVVALDFFALYSHLSPALLVGVLAEVSLGDFENATTDGVSSNF